MIQKILLAILGVLLFSAPVPAITLDKDVYFNQRVRYWLHTKSDLDSNFTLIENELNSIDAMTEAPLDSQQYARFNGTWVVVTGGTGDVEEAPTDSQQYARFNGTWVLVDHPDIIPEAPQDSQQYARFNGTWAIVAGGSFDTASNYTVTGDWIFQGQTTFNSFLIEQATDPSLGDYSGDTFVVSQASGDLFIFTSTGLYTIPGTYSTATVPTMTSAVIPTTGATIDLTMDASVSIGAGGNSGFNLDCATAGTDITMTYSSGAPGTALTYTLGTTVNSGDTCDLDYTQPGNGIESTAAGMDLVSITDGSVTNSSTQGVACTTPTTGSELNEGALGTGFENTWVNVSGTSTTNPDATLLGTPPTRSCTEGIGISYAIGDTPDYYTHDLGSVIPGTNDTTVELTMYVGSYTIPFNGRRVVILNLGTNPDGGQIFGNAWLEVSRDAGVLAIRANTPTDSAYVPIAVDTWYTVKLFFDGTTAADSYLQVDGGTTYPFTPYTDGLRYLHLGAVGQSSGEEALEAQIGDIYVDTTP